MFGTKSWPYILDKKRKALERKSEKCIFDGYSEDVKGYRLLNNLNPLTLLLEKMLNLMEIFWHASLIYHMCHLQLVSHLQ